MKKSISPLLFVSLMLATSVCISADVGTQSKTHCTVKADNARLITTTSPVAFEVKALECYMYDVAVIEPGIVFGFVKNAKETFASITGNIAKAVMFRLPNSYG